MMKNIAKVFATSVLIASSFWIGLSSSAEKARHQISDII